MRHDHQRTSRARIRGPGSWRWLSPVLAVLLGAGPAHAHEQWIKPNFFHRVADSAWLTFDHSFSDNRFQPDSAPGSYYRWWTVGPDGMRRSVPLLNIGHTRVTGEVELKEPGTYRLEGEEPLMAWTQLEVEGEQRWQPGSRDAFTGRTITKSILFFNKVISFVTLGDSSEGALAASGDPLEIVFEDHPANLQAGKPFIVRVLSYGAPQPDVTVQLHSERTPAHDAAAAACGTGPEGDCQLVAPGAGIYLLKVATEGPSKNAETDEWAFAVSVMLNLQDPEQ